jgi:hypothetical protein
MIGVAPLQTSAGSVFRLQHSAGVNVEPKVSPVAAREEPSACIVLPKGPSGPDVQGRAVGAVRGSVGDALATRRSTPVAAANDAINRVLADPPLRFSDLEERFCQSPSQSQSAAHPCDRRPSAQPGRPPSGAWSCRPPSEEML